MIQRVLSHYHLLYLTCFGLILFMMVFIGCLFWVFRRGSSNIYALHKRLPFDELNKCSTGEP